MSVLINGMNLPEDGCHHMVCIYSNGVVVTNGGHWIAEELPPHGKLIDASKIGLTDFEIILCQKGNPFKNALEMLLEKIEKASTIIPASEAGE